MILGNTRYILYTEENINNSDRRYVFLEKKGERRKDNTIQRGQAFITEEETSTCDYLLYDFIHFDSRILTHLYRSVEDMFCKVVDINFGRIGRTSRNTTGSV